MTNQIEDTFTISLELLRDTKKFQKLADSITNASYMSHPHNINWNDSARIFESCAPFWIDINQPNTVAKWFFYYMERALSICYLRNVKGNFQNCTEFVNSKIEKENANKMA